MRIAPKAAASMPHPNREIAYDALLARISTLLLLAALSNCGTSDTGNASPHNSVAPADAAGTDASLADAIADRSASASDDTSDASTDVDQFIETLRARYSFDPKPNALTKRMHIRESTLPKDKQSAFPASVASSIRRDGARLSPVFEADGGHAAGNVTLTLPDKADGTVEMQDVRSAMKIAARLTGARSAPAELSKGYVVYRDALPSGVSVIEVPKATGTEDWVSIESSETTSLSYTIDLAQGVSGLRLFSNSLEMLDDKGMPRLRVSPPRLIDANLKSHDATLALSGCDADTDPAPPWSHAVRAPGAKSCTLQVSWDASKVAYPVLLDPSWSSTASLAVGRSAHVAGWLDDGTMLVAGGVATYRNVYDTMKSVERLKLEPDGIGAWTMAAELPENRAWALGVVRGSRFYVLQGGGNDACHALASSVYFDTATNLWVTIPPGSDSPRERSNEATATLFADGRILLAGALGSSDCGATPWTPENWVDIYDTVNERWTRGPDLPVPRASHAADLIAGGRAMIAGGQSAAYGGNPNGFLKTSVLYDPVLNQWLDGPTLQLGRIFHGLVSLSTTSPDVITFGGEIGESFPPDPSTYSTTERWTGGSSFRQITPGLLIPREWMYTIAWATLTDGTVLAGPGMNYVDPANNWVTGEAEIFHPDSETWTSAGQVSPLIRPLGATLTQAGNTGNAFWIGGISGQFQISSPNVDLYTYTPPSNDAGSDAPEAAPLSQTCGDSIRHASLEECDRGASTNRNVCTADCRVRDLLAVVDTGDSGTPAKRTLGDGPHPIAAASSGAFAVTFAEPDSSPLRLGLTTFSESGVASDVVTSISAGSTPVLMANPVVAAVPNGKFAVAYADFNGDGDELGVALRIVDPANPPTGAPSHANTTTNFSQYDPDLIATSSGLVAAWVDDSDAATAPDIKWRTFGFDLQPTSAEQTLANTSANEGDVTLATFGSGWAAAWRAGDSGTETLYVKTGSTQWTIGPYMPGPVGDRPALVELDATHLLVVYAEGIDREDSGIASGSKLRAAVLDTASPGTASASDITAMAGGESAASLSQGRPTAARVGDRIYVGWHTEAPLANAIGEELWIKALSWNASQATIDFSSAEEPLPRWQADRAGDQRRPAFAAGGSSTAPELLAAFEDLGQSHGAHAQGVVVVEDIPSPVVRLGEMACANQPDGTSCSDGNLCNGSETCQSGQCITSGPAPSCTDLNRCTADSCNSVLGCLHVKNDATCSPFDPPHRLSATITASSSADGYPASNAGDNQTTTQWLASLTSSPQNNNAWIQLDFGAAKQIDRLRWTAASGMPAIAASPANYVVETSDDATNWSQVTSRVTTGVIEGSEFVGRTARYLRLTTTQVLDGAGSALSFFEIWGEGVDYQLGDAARWQVFDSFDAPLSSELWTAIQGSPATSNGKLVADATSTAIILAASRSLAQRSVHVKGFHELQGSGRCWFIGYVDPTFSTGILVRRDLNPSYVDASIQEHLFASALRTPAEFVDLGTFGSGPALDITFGWYGHEVDVDVSKDGTYLTHHAFDASFFTPDVRFTLVDYCSANVTVDDLLAAPL
jgi:hypothetical protein